MRTGSPSGWRSAVNTAIAQTTTTSGNTVRNYLKPNSPFFMMVDDFRVENKRIGERDEEFG